MRIAIVRREPEIAISMDVYADNLVSELRQIRSDWTITEVAPEPWWNGGDNLWHSGTGLRKYYERFWRHPRNVKRQEVDLFHIIDHSNAHVAYWLASLGKPIVITCHDLVQFVYPEILRDQARFPAFSLAAWQYSVRGMLKADRVIAVSTNTASDVEKMLSIPQQNITVVPNGVDAQFQPLALELVQPLRQKHTSSLNEICLLNVGSSHQRKNIFAILKAIHLLKQQGVPVRLWKVSDDFTAEQKTFIQTHSLDQQVSYLGKLDRSMLLQIYSAADMLIAPSLYEGFGLTVLEAMACGTPVITSNVSSLPEVAGNAAILVDPLDVEAIAQAVLQVQADRRSFQQKGLARVQQFTWRRTAEQVAQVYESLIEAQSKSPPLHSRSKT